MDVDVLRFGSLAPGSPHFDHDRRLETDGDTDASVVNSNAQASSYEDDMKGSDGWRRSNASSKVTTPDLSQSGAFLRPSGLNLDGITKTATPSPSTAISNLLAPSPPPPPGYHGSRSNIQHPLPHPPSLPLPRGYRGTRSSRDLKLRRSDDDIQHLLPPSLSPPPPPGYHGSRSNIQHPLPHPPSLPPPPGYRGSRSSRDLKLRRSDDDIQHLLPPPLSPPPPPGYQSPPPPPGYHGSRSPRDSKPPSSSDGLQHPLYSASPPSPPPPPGYRSNRSPRDLESRTSNGNIKHPPQTPPQTIGPPRPSPPSPTLHRTPASNNIHHDPTPPPLPRDRPAETRGIGVPTSWEQMSMLRSPPMSAAEQQIPPSRPAPRGGWRGRQRKMPRANSGKMRSHRGSTGSSDADSSTFQLDRTFQDDSSESSASSEEDPLVYRNAMRFPPQLPAALSHRSPLPSRSSQTTLITSWISRNEKSGSPQRKSRNRAGRSITSDTSQSDETCSTTSRASSLDEVETLWQQLKEKRSKLHDTKNQMAAKRVELREMRRKKDDFDNAFMSVIRPMLVNHRGLAHTSTTLLERRFREMQQARTDYHFLESTYEGLEVVLDEDEGELNRLETRFFSLLATGRTRAERRVSPLDDADASLKYPSDVPDMLRGISRDGPPEDVHPLYVKLTSAIGDLENAREEYNDLLFTREQHEYDLELNKSTGIATDKKASEEMREFFDGFPSEEKKWKETVSVLENEVQRLRNLCKEKNVMRKHMSVRMEYVLDPHIEFDDMDLDATDTLLATRKTLAHDRFPELLSQPDHVLANPEPLTPLGALRAATELAPEAPEKRTLKRLATKEYSIDLLMKEVDWGGDNRGQKGNDEIGKKGDKENGKGSFKERLQENNKERDIVDFVNRWMLLELRLSPLNVLLLQSTFVRTQALNIRDSRRWQCDVLHYWWHDNDDGAWKDHGNESNGSEIASRGGTPQMSRAASDSGVAFKPMQHHQRPGSDSGVAFEPAQHHQGAGSDGEVTAA